MSPIAKTPDPSGIELVGEAGAIVQWMSNYSVETTRPTAADFVPLAGVMAPGTPIYLSAVPLRPHAELTQAAIAVRDAGFEPVPHLAARSCASRAALDELLAGLMRDASVRRALIVAGDYERPLGPYGSAIDVIESGILTQHGIAEIGIAGYPDGHPRISDYELMRILTAKVEAAEATGLAVTIVTQFGFEAAPIINWLDRLRGDGFDQLVRIGMAGPTSASALLRYARRCGVAATAQGLARHAGLAKHLFSGVAPDKIIRALASSLASLGRIEPHFYSFGGLAACARWAAAVAAGRIELDRADGFRVMP